MIKRNGLNQKLGGQEGLKTDSNISYIGIELKEKQKQQSNGPIGPSHEPHSSFKRSNSPQMCRQAAGPIDAYMHGAHSFCAPKLLKWSCAAVHRPLSCFLPSDFTFFQIFLIFKSKYTNVTGAPQLNHKKGRGPKIRGEERKPKGKLWTHRTSQL